MILEVPTLHNMRSCRNYTLFQIYLGLGCVDFRDPISLSDYLMKKILPILRMAVRMASILLIVRETASKVVTKHRQLRRFSATQHGMSQRNVQEYRIFQNKNICLQPLWLVLILQASNMFIGWSLHFNTKRFSDSSVMMQFMLRTNASSMELSTEDLSYYIDQIQADGYLLLWLGNHLFVSGWTSIHHWLQSKRTRD